MNEAIKLAIRRGEWLPRQGCSDTNSIIIDASGRDTIWRNLNGRDVVTPTSEIFTDPLFWQALGKALGWEANIYIKPLYQTANLGQATWAYYAHHWLGAHMAGPEAEDKFWKELLTNQNQ